MSASSSFQVSHSYSRKQKSLGLLCSKFVSLYDRAGVGSVGLDDAARQLNVERRRIYDIVNILESVGVLVKKAKNQYSWIGFSGIPKALETLKEEGLRENFGTKLTHFKSEDLDNEDDDKSLEQGRNFEEEKLCIKAKPGIENKKEKSLCMLTENFVKLFLTTETESVSLDEAARLLLGDTHDSKIMRTKVRRLYDIANVLSSLNLIEKTQQVDTRKPAFRWLGLNGKRDNNVTPPSPKRLIKRSFGVDITNADLAKRSKQVHSGDQNPTKIHMRTEDLKECNLTTQKQLQGSKDYVFGPFSPLESVIQDKNVDDKGGKEAQDWESLADSHRPEYHNQGGGHPRTTTLIKYGIKEHKDGNYSMTLF